jgi:hypothetical protein
MVPPGEGPCASVAVAPYGVSGGGCVYNELDFDMSSDDDSQEPAPAGSPAPSVIAEAAQWTGEQSAEGTDDVSDVDEDFALSDAAISLAQELRCTKSGGALPRPNGIPLPWTKTRLGW